MRYIAKARRALQRRSIGILGGPMRLAVLSDIHANLVALEAVRADLPAVDEVWVLGDIVGYGPRPNEVIATLQEMGARSVLGNHDGAAIGTVDPADFNPDAHAAITWTRDVLDANARAYVAALPEVRRDGRAHRGPRLAARSDMGVHRQRPGGGRQPRRVRHPPLPLRSHPPAGHLRRHRGGRHPRRAGDGRRDDRHRGRARAHQPGKRRPAP